MRVAQSIEGSAMKVLTFTEPGGHPRNEDAFEVHSHPSVPDRMICFVADGQGGRAGGRAAAELACRAGIEIAFAIAPERLAEPQEWIDLLSSVDEIVARDSEAGYTTLIGLSVSESGLAGASVGDSAAVLAIGDRLFELTRGQRKNPPIGSGSALPVAFNESVAEPWRLLMMSDGVWKYSGWTSVAAAVRSESGSRMIEDLQQSARLPGTGRFQDDFTVVLLESDAPAIRV